MKTEKRQHSPGDIFQRILQFVIQIREWILNILGMVSGLLAGTPIGSIAGRLRRWRGRIPHLYLFPVVLLWDEIWLRLFNGTPLFSHFLYPVVYALSAGIFFTALTSLFKRRINRRVAIVLLGLLSLFFTVECLLKRTYNFYMTFSTIVGGTGQVVGEFGGELVKAIIGGIIPILIFFLPLILYIAAGKRRMPAWRYHPMFAGILLVLSLLVGGGGTLAATLSSSVKDVYKGQFEYTTATQIFGLVTSTRLEIKYGIFGNPDAGTFLTTQQVSTGETEGETEETPVVYGKNEMDIDFDSLIESASNDDVRGMHEYVSSLTASSQNEYTGLFEGKNLIIIAAESFASQAINEELTPTLYRLANQGIKFTEFYQPAWGGSTSTGEYSILMGIVPTNGGQTVKDTIGNNLYFTMGNQLQRLNYTTLAFHNGQYTTYGRDQTHTNLGYDQFLAWGNGLEDIVTSGKTDIATFSETLDYYIDMQPFHAYYMSFSGHCPYVESNAYTSRYLERVQEVLGTDTYMDTTMYYFCNQMVLEEALEGMVETLEEKGIADDTVIVLCTDHYPYGLADTYGDNTYDYLKDLHKDDNYSDFTRDNTTLIIWSGCIEGMNITVDEPTMSLDILPTLSNLFGIEYDSRLLVGRDVFSDAEPLALWMNQSFVTDMGYYDRSTGEFTLRDGVTMTEEEQEAYLSNMKAIVANKITFSSQVNTYDYYGILFGEDDIK